MQEHAVQEQPKHWTCLAKAHVVRQDAAGGQVWRLRQQE